MKKLSSCFPVALSGRAVPLGFNLAMNRYDVPVKCSSDITQFYVWFYEYHGLYWFGFQVNGKDVNSIPYVSASNCVRGLRYFIRTFGFRFDDLDSAEACFKGWRSSFVPAPKSWKV